MLRTKVSEEQMEHTFSILNASRVTQSFKSPSVYHQPTPNVSTKQPHNPSLSSLLAFIHPQKVSAKAIKRSIESRGETAFIRARNKPANKYPEIQVNDRSRVLQTGQNSWRTRVTVATIVDASWQKRAGKGRQGAGFAWTTAGPRLITPVDLSAAKWSRT